MAAAARASPCAGSSCAPQSKAAESARRSFATCRRKPRRVKGSWTSVSNTPTRMRADCTNGSGSFLSRATSRSFTCAGCRPLQVNAPDRKVVGTRYDDCPGSTDLALAVPHVARRQLRPAGLADRPRTPGRQIPAARPRSRAVAARRRVPGGGPGRRDPRGDPVPGAGGPRHHHRRRDPARELLQPLRHGIGRGRHRQPRRGARSQRAPQPGPARRRRDPASSPGAGARHRVPASQHRSHDQGHGPRSVHDVSAGAERLLPRPRVTRHGVRRGLQRGDQGPVRGRRRHRAAGRALPAGTAGGGSGVRCGRADAGARRSDGHDGRPPVLRLRRHHPRPPIGVLVPVRARRLSVRPGLDRDGAVGPRPRRSSGRSRARR